MLHCWNEDPLQRPTFTYLRKHLDHAISTGAKYITFNINEENRYYDILSFKKVPNECAEDELIIKELMNRPMQVKTIDELNQIQQNKKKNDQNSTLKEVEEITKLAENLKALEGNQSFGKEGRYKNSQPLIPCVKDKLKSLGNVLDKSSNNDGESDPSHIYIIQDETTTVVA